MPDTPEPVVPPLYVVSLRHSEVEAAPWLGVSRTVTAALALLHAEWGRRRGPGVPGELLLIVFRDGVEWCTANRTWHCG
jgi:hypothetical protein